MLIPGLFYADDFKEYNLPDIKPENQGYYLPSVYIEELKRTKSHPIAMSRVKNNTHNLIISKNRIDFIASYHDAAAISLGKFNKFEFADNYLIDNTGLKYIKISDFTPDNFDTRFDELIKIATKLLLETIFDSKEVFNNDVNTLTVSEDFSSININKELYKPLLNVVFAHQKYNTFKDSIALEVTEDLIIIHKLLPASEGPGISEETEIILKFNINE